MQFFFTLTKISGRLLIGWSPLATEKMLGAGPLDWVEIDMDAESEREGGGREV